MTRFLHFRGGIVSTIFAFCLFVFVVITPLDRVRVYGDAVPELETRLTNGIKYLASDDLEGRGVGTKGLDLAADYILQKFESVGLDVERVDGEAYQKFEIQRGGSHREPDQSLAQSMVTFSNSK